MFNKTVQLRTARPGTHRGQVIDLRAKIGQVHFAPSINLIIRKMKNELTLEQFLHEYMQLLNNSIQEYPQVWVQMLKSRKALVVSDIAYVRVAFALFCTKMGAVYPNVENNVLTDDQIKQIQDFEITKHKQATLPDRKMVIDPLTVNSVQSSICRMCRDNRMATAWTPAEGNVAYKIVDKNEVDQALGARNQSCCATGSDSSFVCPIFQHLVDGYQAGVTSQGTNINPCKHCPTHVDNGGDCFGDRCSEGPFDIIPGAGLVKS